ncbi:hypothetical protein NEOLEDRAFT_1242219 [Neolentinus lepideus HHB14362 ss-1]|uniref:Nudix hydrolase domain-containing protein n=1 Tax=Neolentinus lepideus HHB14362 ss-1 TaxID=1314782 RepID=A0A165S989_9AGAM|nr:hypothetical protein NEOLEDRAFT_1242219 [Neolentinus lepideus HHB14362 ss-1]
MIRDPSLQVNNVHSTTMAHHALSPVTERSYGIVLVRPSSANPTSLKSKDVEVLLIHQHLRPGPRLPSNSLMSLPSSFIALPKGHKEPADSTDLAAAVRELHEETGLGMSRILCGEKAIKERYTNPRNGKEKENTFWIGLVEGNGERVKIQVEEVEGAEWERMEEAIVKVTYEETKAVLREAARMLDEEQE